MKIADEILADRWILM